MKIKKGERGRAVADIQARLLKLGYRIGTSGVDEVFGEDTEKALKDFQNKRGLRATGTLTRATWAKLVEESYELGDRLLYFHYPYFRGNDVRALQERLKAFGFNPGQADAIFGPQTSTALKEFQQSAGLLPDGILGYSTLKALASVRTLTQPGAVALRFPRRKEDAQKLLQGRCVHLGINEKASPPETSELVSEVAVRLKGILKGYRVNVVPVIHPPGKKQPLINEPEVKLLIDGGGKDKVIYKPDDNRSARLANAVSANLNKMTGYFAVCEKEQIVNKEPGSKEARVTIVLRTKKTAGLNTVSLEEESQKVALSIAEGLKNYFRDLP